MEKLPLTHVSPSHSGSSCVSSGSRGHGRYLYDDYAREIPPPQIQPIPSSSKNPKTRSPFYIVAWLAVVVFLVQLGAGLSDVPSTRLLEDILCRKYHHITSSAGLVPEDQCSAATVQGELNILSMGALILGYLPGILVALPYGSLADRRGRKGILGMCVLGMVLSQLIWAVVAWNWRRWALRSVWASSAALLIGGGESVAEAMVFAMIADVAPQEKRAIYFQVEICAVLVAESIAPFIASAMMAYSVWLPILASPAVMTIGGLAITAIPETLERRTSGQATGSTPTSSREQSVRRCTYGARAPAAAFDASTPWTRCRDGLGATLRMLRDARVRRLIPAAALTIPVATVTMSLMLRYVPLRFGLTLAQTGMVLGLQTAASALAMPLLVSRAAGWCWGWWCRRRSGGRNLVNNTNGGAGGREPDPQDLDLDLVLARVSAALLVAGQVLFAAAPTAAPALAGLVPLALGTAAPALCRAALTRLVGDDGGGLGRLFGVLALCEMVGFVAGGAGLGALYQVGLARGLGAADGEQRWWLGLAFYVAAAVYLWCAGLLWLVDARGLRRGGEDVESVHSGGTSGGGSKEAYEARVLADGRVKRKCPSLENVSVAD